MSSPMSTSSRPLSALDSAVLEALRAASSSVAGGAISRKAMDDLDIRATIEGSSKYQNYRLEGREVRQALQSLEQRKQIVKYSKGGVQFFKVVEDASKSVALPGASLLISATRDEAIPAETGAHFASVELMSPISPSLSNQLVTVPRKRPKQELEEDVAPVSSFSTSTTASKSMDVETSGNVSIRGGSGNVTALNFSAEDLQAMMATNRDIRTRSDATADAAADEPFEGSSLLERLDTIHTTSTLSTIGGTLESSNPLMTPYYSHNKMAHTLLPKKHAGIAVNGAEDVKLRSGEVYSALLTDKSRARAGRGTKGSSSSKQHAAQSATSTIGTSNGSVPSQPSLAVYESRLEKVRLYDVKFSTKHCDYLRVVSGGIICDACNPSKIMSEPYVFFSDKGGKYEGHILSDVHIKTLKSLATIQGKQPKIAQIIKDITPLVDINVKTFRYDLVMLCLTNNWCLTSLDSPETRLFVTKHAKLGGKALSQANHMVNDYIPAICATFEATTAEAVKDRLFSMGVDTTTRVGEWAGLVTRYVDKGSPQLIVQRPILYRLKKKLTERGEHEMSSIVVQTVARLQRNSIQTRANDACGDFENPFGRIVAWLSDRASLNRATFLGATIKTMFPKAIFIDCHAHTFANTGQLLTDTKARSPCQYAVLFWDLHIGTFARGTNVSNLWLSVAGSSMKHHSAVRWFSKRVIIGYILKHFETYISFLGHADYHDARPESNFYRMRKLMHPQYWPRDTNHALEEARHNAFKVKLDLAVVFDCSKRLHQACYNLEGDGPLALFAFDEVVATWQSLQVVDIWSFENVRSAIDEWIADLPDGVDAAQERLELKDYVLEKLLMLVDYFRSHFIEHPGDRDVTSGDNMFGHLLPMYEAMALCNPDFVRRQLTDGMGMDMAGLVEFINVKLMLLVNMNRITDDLRHRLLAQANIFINLAIIQNWSALRFHAQVKAATDFWKKYWDNHDISAWVEFAEICFLHQPSSCSVERLFSILKAVLGVEKEGSLDDLVKAGVYARYEATYGRLRQEFEDIIVDSDSDTGSDED